MASSVDKSKFKRLQQIAVGLIDWQDGLRCRHFSFVIYKNRIITIGLNKRKTHPTNLRNRKISYITGEDYSQYKTICSEFNAIIKLKKKTNIETKRCTLVNLRYDKKGNLAIAKPCMSCMNLLKNFEFKRVIWSNNDGNYEENN
jgi:hypothetical protein